MCGQTLLFIVIANCAVHWITGKTPESVGFELQSDSVTSLMSAYLCAGNGVRRSFQAVYFGSAKPLWTDSWNGSRKSVEVPCAGVM